MAVFYCKSGAGAAEFAQSTAYVSGDKIVPKLSDAGTNFAVARKWVWECTTGGTSAGAEPTWPASVTQDVTTVTSNTAVFTARKPGFSSGTTANWAYSTIYLLYAVTCPTTAGDTIYVSNNHAETPGATYAMAPVNTTNIICVDDSATPPTATATTASVTVTGTYDLTLSSGTNNVYYEGINFICGAGSAATVTLAARLCHLRDCTLQLASTGASSRITIANYTDAWENVSFKFADVGQSLTVANGMSWIGGSLMAGSASPTNLFVTAGNHGEVKLRGLDLSSAAATINLLNVGFRDKWYMYNCRLPASWSGQFNLTAPQQDGDYLLYNSDSSATNYILQRRTFYGTVLHELSIVRTGGATDGTTPIAWKMTSATVAVFPGGCLKSPEIVIWNNTTGATVTATVEIVSSATLKDNEVWLDIEGYGTSGVPLSVLYSDRCGTLTTPANQTTSTATWASSPATPVYQKLVVTFTPQLKGFIHAVVKLAKASTTVYVDPKITLS